MTLAFPLGWQHERWEGALGWLSPRGGIVVAAVACPLPAVGVALDTNGSGCRCRVWDTELLPALNPEGTGRDEQYSPLPFSPPYSGEFV